MSDVSDKEIKQYCYKVAETAVTSTRNLNSFSPNNIKRLIISPDGVGVQLFLGASIYIDPFNVEKAKACFSHQEYVPMISVLGGKRGQSRVCSHIQEVVYCLKGINGLTLRKEEQEFRSILSSVADTSQAELFKAINARFSRLNYITMANMTFTDLIKIVGPAKHGGKLEDDFYFIGEENTIPEIKGYKITGKTPWYEETFLRPEYYELDKFGSALYKTLEKIKQKGKALEIVNTRNGAVNELLGGKTVEAFSMTYASLKAMLMLHTVYDKANFVFYIPKDQNTVRDILSRSCYLPEIPEETGIIPKDLKEIMNTVGVRRISSGNRSSAETVSVITRELTNISFSVYTELCNLYLTSIGIAMSKFPIATKVRLGGAKMTVSIPDSLKASKESIELLLDRSFSNVSFNESIATMCSALCRLLIDCDSSDKLFDTRSIDYWENRLKLEVE